MTSGNFKHVPVDSIFVSREARQRRELKNIDSLAISIRRIGLIHPLVIEESGELRAGERRLEAIKKLGWTNVPVQLVTDLSESELQLLELEENIRRDELPWADNCAAVAHYNELRKEEDTGWTGKKTAEALGLSRQEVADRIAVHSEITKGNLRVVNAPKYSVARNLTRRSLERKATHELERVEEAVAGPKPKAKTKPAVPLINDDFNKWAKTYKGAKFNLIHCDFPYGIHSDAFDQGKGKEMGDYEDTYEVYRELLKSLDDAMDTVVAESAHLIFWFSMEFYRDTFDTLTSMGWKVDAFPLIWYKSDNSGILPDPNRGPRRGYESAFFASRGDRKIVRAVSNVVGAPSTKRIHPHEKSESMLKHFMRMLVDEYTVMLDPTAGSAGAVRVVKALGAPKVLGIEKDKEFFQLAKERFYEPTV